MLTIIDLNALEMTIYPTLAKAEQLAERLAIDDQDAKYTAIEIEGGAVIRVEEEDYVHYL